MAGEGELRGCEADESNCIVLYYIPLHCLCRLFSFYAGGMEIAVTPLVYSKILWKSLMFFQNKETDNLWVEID